MYAFAHKEGLMKDVKILSHQQMQTFNRMRAVLEDGVEPDRAAVEEASTAFDSIWEELENGAGLAAGAANDESAGAFVRRKFNEYCKTSGHSQVVCVICVAKLVSRNIFLLAKRCFFFRETSLLRSFVFAERELAKLVFGAKRCFAKRICAKRVLRNVFACFCETFVCETAFCDI